MVISNMFQLLMDKQFIPVVACAITVFLILMLRPSILVHSSADKGCPFCLNKWYVTAIVLAVGGAAYVYINQDVTRPSMAIYN